MKTAYLSLPTPMIDSLSSGTFLVTVTAIRQWNAIEPLLIAAN